MQNNQSMTNKVGGFDLVKMTGYTREQIELIKQTVAKGTSDSELALFLSTSKEVNLSPLLKEIWCYKDYKGNMIMFAGRDGFRTIAQRSPNFSALNSMEVCDKDQFEMGARDGQMYIEHKFSGGFKDRGNIIGAYCIITLKDGGRVYEWADIKDYDRAQAVWKTHRAEMARKVAEVHAIKKMANIRGIYAEEEYNIKDGKVMAIDVDPVKSNADSLKESVPNKITPEQMDELRKLFVAKGKEEKNFLNHVGSEKMEDINWDVAEKWIKALRSNPDIKDVVEGEFEEIIEEMPKKDVKQSPDYIEPVPKKEEPVVEKKESRAAELMKKGLKSAAKEMNMVDPVGCDKYNELINIMDRDLSEEEKQLIYDCDHGQYKGQAGYPTLFIKNLPNFN